MRTGPRQTSGRSTEAGIMTVSPTWIHRCVHADRAGGGGACSAVSAGGGGSGTAGAAVIEHLRPVSGMTHVITADDGKESPGMRRSPGVSAPTFTSPAPLTAAGVSGRTNGPAREQLPKPTDFRTTVPAEIRRVRDALNDRPRRCLVTGPRLSARAESRAGASSKNFRPRAAARTAPPPALNRLRIA